VFPWLVQFIEAISGSASIEQKIANSHMIFNAGGVLLILPFITLIEKLINKLLPVKEALNQMTSENHQGQLQAERQ
jgi:phosphate:Na+ symporter